MGASSEMVSLVCLDKSLWHTVRALEPGELPAWELPLLGRACSAFCQQSCPFLPVNLAIPPPHFIPVHQQPWSVPRLVQIGDMGP